MGVKIHGVTMENVGISTSSPFLLDLQSDFNFDDHYFANSNTGNGLRPFGPFTAYGHNGQYPLYTSAHMYTQSGKLQFSTGAVNGTTVGLSMGQVPLSAKSIFKTRANLSINSNTQGGYFFFGQINTLNSVHPYVATQMAGLYFFIQTGEFGTQRTLQNGQQERITLGIKGTAAGRWFDLEAKTDGSRLILSIDGVVYANWSIGEISASSNLYNVVGFTNSNTQTDVIGPSLDSLSIVVQP
ncbi:MAG: hypothetical protein EOP83_09035 [Verrucomicrobiaceae bacterium]|nr:MAG: hypothetical protein EOP83_09035 [Verrucomicrobiaceae bacterium]